LAGAPCAFACHFDSSVPAGTGNDYFGLARSTIGQTNQVTLRFDQVKAAVNTLITSMSQDNNTTLNNLNVGVFTFDSALTQVYPPSGQAGNNWTAAIAAVGTAPTSPNQPDTGIQPYGGNNVADTNFPDTMTALSNLLTAAGDGTTSATPKKVLFLVTDGVEDYTDSNGNRYEQAIDYSYCTTFKNMGYSIYVVYTPYYPLMNDYYLNHLYTIVEGTGPGTVSYNLQQCASSADTYIAATDGTAIQAALQTFLARALVSAAKFTQ
jgi:hypothetical protein